MKATVVAIAIGVLGLAPSASGLAAQQSDSDQILAKAEIVAALTVRGARDLDFGTLLGGTTVVVDPTEPNAGKFELDAQPGAEVQVEFTQLPSELTRTGGSEVIPLSLVGTASSTDNPSTGVDIGINAGTWVSTFPLSGQAFVWVGGTITPATDQPVGTYEATVELTATYTGN